MLFKVEIRSIPSPVLFHLLLFLLLAGLAPSSAAEEPPSFLLAWGGQGTGQGEFTNPEGIAIGPGGLVYVADTANHRIQIFDREGNFVFEWGSLGVNAGEFFGPTGISFDDNGCLYVADRYNRRIQKFGATGNFIATWGTFGSGPGEFWSPADVAIGPDGSILVADTGNNRIQKFNASGQFMLEWGSFCQDPPNGGGCVGNGDGQFAGPYGLTVAANGDVYVTDTYNSRVQRFDANGNFLTKWGNQGVGNGEFDTPSGLEVGTEGNVYVADPQLSRVQVFDASGNFLTMWGTAGFGAGEFHRPMNVTVHEEGDVYVVDFGNHQVHAFGEVAVSVATGQEPRVLGWSPRRNPAQGSVSWNLQIPRSTHVLVTIHDVRGRRIRRAQEGVLPAGQNTILWDGLDAFGEASPTGVYFARAQVMGTQAVSRIVFIR